VTTIDNLKKMNEGQRTGGFEVVVASTIKPDSTNRGHIFPFIFKDTTGEMVAAIYRKEWIPVKRGDTFHVTVGEIQAATGLKKSLGDMKLFLQQWEIAGAPSEPELAPAYGASNSIGIKCHIARKVIPAEMRNNPELSLDGVFRIVAAGLRTDGCKELIEEIKRG
jgi:hypothetical protein